MTHHVHILEFNGDSYRLKHSTVRKRHVINPDSDNRPAADRSDGAQDVTIDQETGEILDT